ncbi:hypothetical protein BDZ90DRAFT_33366 [Jaminaea rosea]|uniref:Pkinase-domain-containing protein n=1 Tax=Jaminaea rosea TaxID=1569628 RepID=A0A316V0K4_9BASI|nr:hypothetical protein BDZ90DRAFT_33366 [Jaminaea rosea]PWN31079.1 hypothetical protein BDZ90DRAFT_33366 [Jaminaea rosea]
MAAATAMSRVQFPHGAPFAASPHSSESSPAAASSTSSAAQPRPRRTSRRTSHRDAAPQSSAPITTATAGPPPRPPRRRSSTADHPGPASSYGKASSSSSTIPSQPARPASATSRMKRISLAAFGVNKGKETKRSRDARPSTSQGSDSDGALGKLAFAALSTPELHLSSDPLIDVEDAEHRHYVFPSKRRGAVDDDDDGMDALPLSGDAAYMSFGAIALQTHGDAVEPRRERNGSNNTTIIRRDSEDETPARPAPSTPSSSQGNWFARRVRKLSASATTPTKSIAAPSAPTLQTPPAPSSSPGAATAAAPRPSMSSSLYDSGSDMSLGGGEYGSGFFSDTARNSSVSQLTSPTEWSVNATASDACTEALQRLRTARSYLHDELSKLTIEEMAQDKGRITALALRQRRGSDASVSRETREFWDSISNGVLLCLLLNRLMPGVVEKIDRRDVDWVKADNLSRFLRALRDHFGIKTQDLFHPLDLADATVEGLDRAVHTILALRAVAKSKGITVRSPSIHNERRHSKRRSLIASTPQTPETAYNEISPADSGRLSASPTKNGGGSDDASEMTVLQHRQAAEAKLFRNVVPVPAGTNEVNGRQRRRRSNEQPAPMPRLKTPSITFDESTIAPKQSVDDDFSSRTPYRDRKMSESALSLTGVAEEEHEDAHSHSHPKFSEGESLEVVVDDESTVDDRSVSPPMAGSGRPRLIAPMAQRRISQEIGIGGIALSSSPRNFRGSFDGAMLSTDSLNGSPVRHVPTRRHSARATASALNPSRDSLLSSTSTAAGLSSSPPGISTDSLMASPRLPFPRPSTTADTPNARRMSANLSVDVAAASSPRATPVRPAFRHMRYTSEVHLPTSGASTDSFVTSPATPSPFERSERGRMFGTPSTDVTPRARFDSGVGSIYGSSATNLLSQEDLATPSSAAATAKAQSRSEAASRHKLVLEEGDKNVTYQMGNCIGRGQFGSVYRALNLTSGQVVAVKRIKLEGRSEEEVMELMNEVDLLKSLVHPSVVKYEGLVRGPEVVSIILEYVENGSLLHTLKAFGNFPEKLVASYVVKILEGLSYLHEQDVVHCDLKAANILTTKNGNVKLSDFGVSLNLKAMEKVQKNDAMGTPNWMAPEVIELKGASTAADIWSLGCTIIELLTGKPPYGDMLAMSALFRIVEDERPPIPEKCSDSLKDFLVLCFQKDPTKRPTAEALFEHDWLLEMWMGHKELKELRTQDSVPFLRRISLDSRRPDVKKLHAAVSELAETTTAETSPQRPKFDGRSFSTPAHEAWSSTDSGAGGGAGGDASNGSSRGGHTQNDSSEDRNEDSAMLQSPEPASASRDGIPSLDPSMLDLSSPSPDMGPLTPEEETRQHSFVKSTFSKAVRCRICRESVRKHAVLCEDCGLICHASCAREVGSPCNLRAQMMLLRQSEVLDKTTANNSGGANGTSAPSSPGHTSTTLLPVSFRLPFGKGKRFYSFKTADSSAESSDNANTTAVSAADTAKGSIGGSSSQHSTERGGAAASGGASGGRKRRISLMPTHKFRARSPAPASRPSSPSTETKPLPSIAFAPLPDTSTHAPPASPPLPPSSPNLMQSPTAAEIVHARTAPERRASAVSFGSSMSPSSSISSAASASHSHMEVIWQKGNSASPAVAARRPSLTTTMAASGPGSPVDGGGRRGSATTTTAASPTSQQSHSSPVVTTTSTTATPRPRFKHRPSHSLATLSPSRINVNDERDEAVESATPGHASADATLSASAAKANGAAPKEEAGRPKRNRKTSFAGLGSSKMGGGAAGSSGGNGASGQAKEDCLIM